MAAGKQGLFRPPMAAAVGSSWSSSGVPPSYPRERGVLGFCKTRKAKDAWVPPDLSEARFCGVPRSLRSKE